MDESLDHDIPCRELYFSAFNTEEESRYPAPFLVLSRLTSQAHEAITNSQEGLPLEVRASASCSFPPSCSCSDW